MRWNPLDRNPHQLDGETFHVTTQDVWGRTYSDPDSSCTALSKIDRDLAAAVACANNQDILTAVRLRISVVDGMDYRAVE